MPGHYPKSEKTRFPSALASEASAVGQDAKTSACAQKVCAEEPSDLPPVNRTSLNSKQSDDSVTLELVIANLVIHGSPASVSDQLHALKQEAGEFGTLLYAGVDWTDRALARNSMVLMAEKVLPLMNA